MPAEHAIVTGAASGIGYEAVRRMLRRGALVTALDRSAALQDVYASTPGVHVILGDVTDEKFLHAAIEEAEKRAPVTTLFHSAGIMPGGEIADTATDDFVRVMDVNYMGTVHTVKAVLPAMRRRGQGTIILMGSVAGYVPTIRFGAYSASKSAVNVFAVVLREEVSADGIHVLLVAPNAVKTPLISQVSGGPPALARVADGSLPMGITAVRVLDDVERALKKGRSVVLPAARGLYALRRVSPRLTWRASNFANRLS
jgi:NAD(P)-dependent dehydrogenase (short-subunit alcohol dehydrogenase family)